MQTTNLTNQDLVNILTPIRQAIEAAIEIAEQPPINELEADKALLTGIFKEYDQQSLSAVEDAVRRYGDSDDPLSQLLVKTLQDLIEEKTNG